jgi:signal transduction histidine kinase
MATAAVLGVLAVAGVLLVSTHRALLTEDLDEALAARADVAAERVAAGRPVSPADLGSDDVVVRVLDGVDSADDETIRTVDTSDGPARQTARRAGDRTVLVAASLDDVEESTAALVRGLLLGIPLSGAALGVLVWWAVGRALRPVEDLRSRLDRITANRLGERLPEPAAAAEIARLAATTNALLARLDRSAEQQRQFVADAAHELRSPLARMRTELEVDAVHPGSADRAATAASALAETVALQRLVDDLLLLAADDAGGTVLRPAPLDLDEVVREVATGTRDPRLDVSGVRPVQVTGDRDQLARAVQNLIDNAVRHARSCVAVTLDGTPAGAELAVVDDGPGVPEGEAERIFERFTRLDDARTAGTGGAGLGLAIARGIAIRHGGSLVLDPSAPVGARFVLRLPLSPGSDDAV